jgi:hypothetical protein
LLVQQLQFALGGGALGRESECNTAQTCEGNTADYILEQYYGI